MYYTYVLCSLKDDFLYVGFSNDLHNRVIQHNSGEVESTASRRPLRLVYYEACIDRDKAIARERYFKTGYGRRFLKQRI